MANTYSTKIDFGTIGIKIGDTINFIRDPSITYKIGSGNGTPDNGGTLLIDEDNGSLSSITVITKKLMGKDFNTDLDIFELWLYKGETLRTMNSKKRIFNVEKYNLENEKIIDEVKKILPQWETTQGFIADGLINPQKYADEPVKIICFLSESYGWAKNKVVNLQRQRRGYSWKETKDNDILGLLSPKVKTTRPLASFLSLFYESISANSQIPFDDFINQDSLKINNQLENNIRLQNTLEKTAWINVRKESKADDEGTQQNYDEVYNHAKQNKDILQKQIEITSPDIILIFSEVAFDSLYDMGLLGKISKSLKKEIQINEYGQMILKLDHPSTWKSYDSIYNNFQYLYESYKEYSTERLY